nr:hyp [Cotesia vestalis bracovirus]
MIALKAQLRNKKNYQICITVGYNNNPWFWFLLDRTLIALVMNYAN